MSASDIFLLIVRWLHLVAAAAWIGGGLFYLLVLKPSLRNSPESMKSARIATSAEFRALVDTCVFVLLTTGVILTVNRLTVGVTGVPYVVTVGVKIGLSIWMFVLARGRRRRTPTTITDNMEAGSVSKFRIMIRNLSGYNTIVILGIAVFLLSDLLKVLFESALSN